MAENYKDKKICIIGTGKVGSALYHSLIKKKYNVAFAVDSDIKNLKFITSGNRKIKLSDVIGKEMIKKSDVLIFAVQEKRLKKAILVCKKFKLDLSNKIVFHLSGIETSVLFNNLRINSANTGSLHPLQTFSIISYKYSNIFNKIFFGIEGGEKAIKLFKKICRDFRSDYIIIPEGKKILYHAACVIASNFMVSHLNIISGIVNEISVKEKKGVEIFKPIMETTLNNIYTHGIEKSLTGPFERGDVSTIELHLKYFKENLPSYIYYYVLSGIEALNLAVKKKSITNKEAKKIEELLVNQIY